MIDRTLSVPPTRNNLLAVTTPELLHRWAMTYLPDLGGMSHAIRHDTTTQFRIDLPSGPCGHPGVITLRLRGDAVDPSLEQVQVPDLVDGVRITATIATETRNDRTGPMRARSVSDARCQEWATALLHRHGLTATELHLSPARSFGRPTPGNLDPGVHFTVRDLLATIQISDPDLAHTAMHRGIGRGRAYGLGMLVPLTT